MKHSPSSWLSVKEAAHALSVSSATIRRLRETLDPCTRRPFLLSRKPTPRLILISAASLAKYQKATQDLEFWDRQREGAFRPGTRCQASYQRRPGKSRCSPPRAPSRRVRRPRA